jgi:cyclophilin family peptidyl-prolyl cis-trans isomerase
MGSVFGQAPDDRINEPAPDSFLVVFETSTGRFDVMAHRAWSPLAADRFYHLVRLGFYDEVSIFRVVEGFVAQFGIHNVEAVNEAWQPLGIEDEPVKTNSLRGTVAFARAGPQTRTTQIFINLKDNLALDAMNYGGVAGYPPFAEVVSGMEETVTAFNAQYGNAAGSRQDSIYAAGRTYLDRAFPGLDYVVTARIEKTYP